MEFVDKVVIVTGASSGIGKATTIAFAEQGAKVAAVSRDPERLRSLSSKNGSIVPFAADVTAVEERTELIRRIVDQFKRVDVLVHAAGIIASGTVESTSLSDWEAMMQINLTSVFHLTQLAVPSLTESRGNIVCVSSVAGTRSFPGILAYSVSKAAVDQFTRCTALELAPKQIRINAVNPGVVITELHRRGGMDETQYANFLERSKTTHPMGRVGNPEEVADLILFLASPKASWITGVTYSIDGGRALTCAR